MLLQHNGLYPWQRIWLSISSPVLLFLIVSVIWCLSYAVFCYLLLWNMTLSLYLSLIISVIGAELSLAWSKRYHRKQSAVVSVRPASITSPYYVPITHDPDAFSKIVGMKDAIEVLKDALELPLRHPELIKHFGLKSGNGLLLHGVPGTGKTALVRAASSYFRLSLFLVNGSAITSMHVGCTEKAIREIFAVAKANAPCIIFFDEFDAIGCRRDGLHLNRPSDLALNSLLTELDGFVSREGVFVIAATNRIDVLDEAVLRPGRFDAKIEVPPPDREGRIALFQFFAKDMPVDRDVEWGRLADCTEGWTGAYIEACVQGAAKIALKRSITTGALKTIVMDDLLRAIIPLK